MLRTSVQNIDIVADGRRSTEGRLESSDGAQGRWSPLERGRLAAVAGGGLTGMEVSGRTLLTENDGGGNAPRYTPSLDLS
jgi:hypothetical protein